MRGYDRGKNVLYPKVALKLDSLTDQDLVGLSESFLQGQRQLSDVGGDELGLRYDGLHLFQPLLPGLPVLIANFRHEVGRDLVT